MTLKRWSIYHCNDPDLEERYFTKRGVRRRVIGLMISGASPMYILRHFIINKDDKPIDMTIFMRDTIQYILD